MSATMQAVIAVLPEGLSRRVAALQTRAFDYDRAINRASAEFDDLMRARKNGDFPVEQHPPVIPGYHWICLPYSTLSGLGSVKTLHRNGIYAVHEDDGEFSIDHLPTGLRVMAFRSFGIAKGLVDMLAKVHPNAHKNAAYGETMRGMQLQVDSVRYFVDNVIKPADVKHTLLGGYSVKRAGKDGSYTFLSADGETEKAKYDGYAWRKASGYAVDNRLLSILNNSSWAPSEGNVQFAFSEKEQEHAKSPAGELMPGRVKFIVDGVDVTAVALGPPDRGRQTWRAFETGKDPVNGDLGRTTINTDDGIAGLKRAFGGVL
jgi:hypothetical protein